MAKPLLSGKISAPYNDQNQGGNDNKYSIANTPHDALYQCSVEFTRDGDQVVRDVRVFDWINTKFDYPAGCTLANNSDTCTITGLQHGLLMRRMGPFGTRYELEYAPGQAGANINNFQWDTDMFGKGSGPWTDPDSDANRDSNRFWSGCGREYPEYPEVRMLVSLLQEGQRAAIDA
jgi:hypothetical protein